MTEEYDLDKMVLRKYSVKATSTTVPDGVPLPDEILSTVDWTVAFPIQVAAMVAVSGKKVIVAGTQSDMDGTNPTGSVRVVEPTRGWRIEETRDLDAVVNACHSPNEETTTHIYVTGQTADEKQAFLRKMAVDTLRTAWTVTMEATGPTAGMACAVTDTEEIWFGGSVREGKVTLGETGDVHQYGGKDIFLAKVHGDGEVDFIRQFGSTEDDELQALTVDAAGNAILAGHTYGSMFRSRESTENSNADVFVMTVSGEDGSMPSVVPQIATQAPPEDTDPYKEAFQEEKNKEKRDETIILVFVIIFLVGFFGCCCYYAVRYSRSNRHSRRHRTMERALLGQNTLLVTDRSHVAPVLSQFDARNVELKRSATGGWHGSFSNELAQGKNVFQPDDDTFYASETENSGMDLLLSDTAYNDSLFKDNDDLIFMDNDEHIEQNDPTNGAGGFIDHGGLTEYDGLNVSTIQRSYACNGLIDAYENRRRTARTISDVDRLVGAYNRKWDDEEQEHDQSDQEIV
jgi:hypothetical protein